MSMIFDLIHDTMLIRVVEWSVLKIDEDDYRQDGRVSWLAGDV